ncbi:hypothetical protein [Streptomyces sp. NPDC048603]|uniref:hypothetical protein n=1 Tax=Streptomyces sp. NPDC048603 TaxID=3365577 RepID=UPI0037249252
MKPCRPQGALRGATDEANALAGLPRELTNGVTVREPAERYGGGRTLWSEYRSGTRIVPLGRLNAVIRDRLRDARGREAMLRRARRLHDQALTAEARVRPAPERGEALRRTEADLAESGRLVESLLAIIAMLLRQRAAPPLAPPPAAADPGPLDSAYDRLGAAWALREAAREAYGRAVAEAEAAGGDRTGRRRCVPGPGTGGQCAGGPAGAGAPPVGTDAVTVGRGPLGDPRCLRGVRGPGRLVRHGGIGRR